MNRFHIDPPHTESVDSDLSRDDAEQILQKLLDEGYEVVIVPEPCQVPEACGAMRHDVSEATAGEWSLIQFDGEFTEDAIRLVQDVLSCQ